MLTKTFVKKIDTASMSMQQWLMISILFSGLLLVARLIATGSYTYLFLVWNLFLGFVPYAISQALSRQINLIENKFKLVAILFVWLLFIPNSFYILTDLFHLEHFDSAPKWFDLLLVFSFAWNGMLLGIISMRRVELILEFSANRKLSLVIVSAVMWLNAFGIYIGRYLRYNSWDAITQPFSLFSELIEILFHPIRNKMEWGMITVYAVFMTILYITIKKLGENFTQQEIKIKK